MLVQAGRRQKNVPVKCLASAKLCMLASSSFCWHLLTKNLTCADKKNLLACADKKIMLTSSDICRWERDLLTRKSFFQVQSFANNDKYKFSWHLVTFADKNQICWGLLMLNLTSSNNATPFLKRYPQADQELTGMHICRVSNFCPGQVLPKESVHPVIILMRGWYTEKQVMTSFWWSSCSFYGWGGV